MSGIAIKERGETAFPAAGDGVVMRFLNTDLKRIQATRGVDFFSEAIAFFLVESKIDFDMIDLYLEHGVKKDGKPYKLTEDEVNSIPVHDLAEIIIDALIRSMKGISAREYVDQTVQAFKDAAEKGEDLDPVMSPTSISSTASDGNVTGPESDQTTSGV